MELGLKGKVAIITGGTEGIGKETAAVLAREGAKVAICSRRQAAVEATVAELTRIGPDVLGLAADVSKPEDVTRLVEATVRRFGRIDILVNNAGTSQRGAFMENDDAVWAADFELKLFGAIRLAKLVIPHMRKAGGGRIINVTNIGAKTPGAGSTPTSISRAAGIALTKAMSKELAADNILVNTVCIGKIKSGQHERRFAKSGESAESYYGKAAKDIPLGRVGETVEAAHAIVFLASDMASYVTGTSINMDGGLAGTL
ncbi:MAG: SDR family oxidoreductase [Burkholderiales bacterium]|nr:SDR family oxidoreductase [Burkholderiales bacterium]